MSFVFKNYSLVKVIYPLIRCCKTRFFLRNTDNTDRYNTDTHIHTQTHTHTHTHTKHSKKDNNTGKK